MRWCGRRVVFGCLVITRMAAGGELSGDLRITPEWRWPNDGSVLSPAAERLRGGEGRLTSDLELRAVVGPVSGVGTLRHVAVSDEEAWFDAIVNELYANHSWAGWYFSAGKKIVSWGVGYAFRPLDVIQQEDRRRLMSTTSLEGAATLVVERFWAESALSVVMASPGNQSFDSAAEERAIAARMFARRDAADWHAVMRIGQQTGLSGGIALAYVATESLELHASVLRAGRLPRLEQLSGADLASTLGEVTIGHGGWRALAGASWTVGGWSFLGELWRDEAAWSRTQWSAWRRSADALHHIPVAGDERSRLLAAHASAFAAPGLHRDNALLRIARTGESFSPSIDVLYTPADQGAVATIRLTWRGDRVQVEAAWRGYAGSRASVVRQLPSASVAFASVSFRF